MSIHELFIAIRAAEEAVHEACNDILDAAEWGGGGCTMARLQERREKLQAQVNDLRKKLEAFK
jgi:hypothetical protein